MTAPLEQAIALYSSGQYPAALELAVGELPPLLDIAACAAYARGAKAEAEKYWRAAVAISPGFSRAHNNLGLLCAEGGRLAEAEAAFRAALALQPGYAEALHNLGAVLVNLRCLDEAVSICRRAVALRPDHAEGFFNLGNALKDAGCHGEAATAFRQAVALKPDYAEAYNNLGFLAMADKRYPEAEQAYRQALALRPSYLNAGFNLALLLLFQGRFSEGWPLFEIRHHPEKAKRTSIPPTLPFPPWQGEALAGQRLLVWYEQGFGDDIQFCRFIPALKARGAAYIGLVCKPPLLPLLATLAGVDAVYPIQAGQNFPGYDYWVLPMSIPLYYGLTLANIPAALPYLHALPERVEKWRGRLPVGHPRVGLVWKGFGGHENDAYRSLDSLATLAPLWSVSGLSFVSLQKEAGEEEAREPPPGQPLTHLGSEIVDFADTAAIVEGLDLVICVDTAIAHLAGALGKPCWVLLPYVQTDWRWLDGREDSPWYPSVLRLFRQGRSESWAEVISRVAEALRLWRAAYVGAVSSRD